MKQTNNVVVKKACHSRGMLSGISLIRLRKQAKSFCLKTTLQKENPQQKPLGMTPHWITARGFTLIELLVVVLIIGILAAVAVPQYQKAVEKSKATQAITLLKSVYQAAYAYYLATGNWPTSFEQLDIDIPWTGTTKYVDSDAAMPTKSNEDWSLQIRTVGTSKGVLVGRLSGPYAGTAFEILYQTSGVGADIPTHKLLCIEGKEQNNVVTPFTGRTGTYCQKIMNANVATLAHASKYFTLS